jgi:PAS domain S-box-containing protein
MTPRARFASPLGRRVGTAAVVLAAIAGAAAGARLWVAEEEAEAVAAWRGQLTAMANDRRAVIESWGEDRQRDARRVAGYPTTLFLAQGGRGDVYPPTGPESARARWVRILQAELDRYDAAWLVAADGTVLASTTAEPVDVALAGRAVALGRVQFEILSVPRWRVLIGAPVRRGPPPEPAIAAVVVSASDQAHPLEALAREPLPTRTGESLLVRRDRDEIVYLSPLRHVAPGLRLPLEQPALAAAAALGGHEEFGDYLDYRGVPVLAAVRPIRGTDLGLVVKIDRAEALGPARRELLARLALLAAMAAAAAGVVFGVWRDRLAARAALSESESRFTRIADNAPDVIYRHQLLPSSRTDYVSPAVRRMLGYSPDDFHADPGLIFRVVHPDDRHLLEECARVERPAGELRLRFLHRDGTIVWTEARNVILRDDQGRVAAVEGIARDITERVVAERTLRTLHVVAEQSPVTILVTDTKGTIEYVNPAFSAHSGYSREEAIGQNPRILKSGEHPPAYYEEIYEALRAGRVWRGELLNRRKDGALYWEQASISPIVDEYGCATHYVAVKENITQAKQAAEALRRAQDQLQQAQRLDSVGRLAGGVAHDFNNLLGVIIGHCERARERAVGDRELEPRLEQVLSAAHRAAELTRQLLAFSRRQVLQPRVLSLNAEVSEMEKMLRRLIGEDVALVVRLDPELGSVRADPSQVAQVLMNLAVNARDAMPEGGTLTIETRNAELDEAFARDHPPVAPGRYVELRVTDDGAGMDEAVRRHVFEPFFTTKPDGMGFGLGLATVYGIVKQSGGYVWLDSSPGIGTTFTIHLPLVEGQAPRPQPSTAPLPLGGRETVLVVEDQDGLRDLIAEMLEDAGYDVLTACDGQAALSTSQAASRPIDLLVTDVVMPGMSGIELARRLRDACPRLRVLLMSGYASGVVDARGEPWSGPSVLEKPFTRTALLERVRQALGEPVASPSPGAGDSPKATTPA